MGFGKHFSYLTTMDEITEGWSKLSLQGPEGDGFNLRAKMGSEEFVLAAKFLQKESSIQMPLREISLNFGALGMVLRLRI